MINKFEFIKEQFYKEEEKKENLSNSLNISITVISGILLIIFYIVTEYDPNKEKIPLNYIFYITIFTSSFFWILCLYYLIKCFNNLYKGYKYFDLPDNFIETEYKSMKIYYDEYKKDLESNLSFDSLVENNIIETINNCVLNNSRINRKKYYYLYKSKIYIINSIFALLIFAICLIIIKGHIF